MQNLQTIALFIGILSIIIGLSIWFYKKGLSSMEVDGGFNDGDGDGDEIV